MPRGARCSMVWPSIGPPTASTIRSKSPSIRSVTTVAPGISRAVRTSAVTWEPAEWASWLAKFPTPPPAPVISTRLPSRNPPTSRERSAVRPACGRVAAWWSRTASGSVATHEVETATSSAQAPSRTRATTRVPAGGPLPWAAGVSTTPATSEPVRDPTGSFSRSTTSPRFKEDARTRTTAWSGSGTGSATVVRATDEPADVRARTSQGLRRTERRRPGPTVTGCRAQRGSGVRWPVAFVVTCYAGPVAADVGSAPHAPLVLSLEQHGTPSARAAPQPGDFRRVGQKRDELCGDRGGGRHHHRRDPQDPRRRIRMSGLDTPKDEGRKKRVRRIENRECCCWTPGLTGLRGTTRLRLRCSPTMHCSRALVPRLGMGGPVSQAATKRRRSDCAQGMRCGRWGRALLRCQIAVSGPSTPLI